MEDKCERCETAINNKNKKTKDGCEYCQGKYVYEDECNSPMGGRFPVKRVFKTVWNVGDKELILLHYFFSYQGGKFRECSIRERSDKLAITRHKKQIMKKLGWIETEKPKKIIVFFRPGFFKVTKGYEKKKTYKLVDSENEIVPKERCTKYTPKKEKLIEEYEKVKEEYHRKLQEIEEAIMD